MKTNSILAACASVLACALFPTAAQADAPKPGQHYVALVNNITGGNSMYIGRWRPNGIPGSGACYDVASWQTVYTTYIVYNGDDLGYYSYAGKGCTGTFLKSKWNRISSDSNKYWYAWY